VINDFDTGSLSAAQIGAITAWVHQGGNLILGTGANFDKVFKNMDPALLQVEKTGEAAIDSLADPAGFYDPADFSAHPLHSAVFAPSAVLTPVLSAGETPLAYQQAFGKGLVLLHSFDLGLAEISENYTAKGILNGLYNERLRTASDQFFLYTDNYAAAPDFIPGQDNSLLNLIFLLIAGYIIFIGPVLYFALKKADKREKGWAAIPACALAATFLIFLISRGSIYTRPFINNTNEITLIDGAAQAAVSRHFVAFSPEKGDIRVSFSGVAPENLSIGGYFERYSTMIRPASGSAQLPADAPVSEQTTAEIRHGEMPGVTYFDAMSWQSNFFNAKGTLPLGGSLSSSLFLEGGLLTGQIINNTAFHFDELVVCYQFFYQKFKDVQPGQTLAVSLQMDDTDPAYADSLLSSYDYANHILTDDMDTSGGYPEDAQLGAFRIKADLLEALLRRVFLYDSLNTFGQSSLLSAEIVAFSDDSLTQTETLVNGKKTNTFTTDVFHMRSAVAAAAGSEFQVAFGVLKPAVISTDAEYHQPDSNSIYLRDAADAMDFDFVLPKQLTVTSFDLLNAAWPSAALAVYHPQTDTWTQLKEAEEVRFTPEYIDGGTIRVRLVNPAQGEYRFPQIRLNCKQDERRERENVRD
jgi:hypothetical protein